MLLEIRVKVLNADEDSVSDEKDRKDDDGILTAEYVRELNRGISYRIRQSNIYLGHRNSNTERKCSV